MKNKIYNYDFLIIGAGLIGSLLALSLIKRKFKIKIVEKNSTISNDQRTLAINANSRDFLDQLGLWEKIKTQPEIIQKIIIQDYLHGNQKIIFNNIGEPMGHVAFNIDLLLITRKQLEKNKCLLSGINLNQNKIYPNKPILLNQLRYSFKKIIFTTGKNTELNVSFSKKKFPTNHRSYVGFFSHTKIHQNIAYEIFTQKGPMAVLPAPHKKKNYSTFIYSTHETLTAKDYVKILKKNFQSSHGSIKLQKQIFQFPLAPHLSKVFRNDVILIGDSLRSMHPVAGQGWNLGVKDIQTFCNLIDQYGIEFKNLDQIYYGRRDLESMAYVGMTSLINYVYDHPGLISTLIIKSSFKTLQKIKPLQNFFIKQAMGRGYSFS